MKKWLLFLGVLLLAGCRSSNHVYYEYVNKVKKANDEQFVTSTEIIDINFYFDDVLNDEYLYRVIIDNPREKMLNVSAILVHDVPTDSIFPSIGVVDSKINLAASEEEGFIKGFILGGYLDKKYREVNFRLLIKYETEIYETKELYYIYNK
jgi:hypothetical protein